ncbi:hypothetical protein [Salaquimonas pukyongi]|uniref:hypothetical protein n=1 Tax=Salaquimonas pukyongi TaxID=2712698 RepID=UPI0012EB750E|nr:hypothetical protein [Salaquimonas pukyongi]
MADYVSIIAKAVSALAENTAANREVIYQKARDTIDRKLRAMDPAPAETAIAAQLQQLEAAIKHVEAGEQAAAAAIAPASEEIPASPSPAESQPAVPTAPQAGLSSVLPEAADTPILIDGIGDKTLQHLEEEGITKLSQIAAMSDGELAVLTEKMGIPGFEKTQEWKEQATALLAGNPPRSKTDQERLRKMLDEAEGSAGEAAPAGAVETAVTAAPAEMPAPQQDTAPVSQPEPATVPQEPAPPSIPPSPPSPAQPDTPLEPAPVPPLETDAVRNVPYPPGEPEMPAAPPQPDIASAPQAPAEPAPRAPEPAVPSGMADRPADTGSVPQPDYVSQLDNDPALESEPPVSRPVPPPRRKAGAGKVLGWLLTILLIGGAGAGAYYYQDELKEAGSKAVNAVSSIIADVTKDGPGDAAEAPAGEQSAGGETGENATGESEPEKDTSRLGDGGSSQSSEPAVSDQETQDTPSEQTAVRDVTPPETEEAPVVETDEPIQLVEPADGGNAASQENSGEQAAETGEAASESGEQQAAASDTAEQPVVLAGEKAFLYEEGFGTNGASRDDGAVSWTLANEAPEEGAAPEAVIKGVMEVPARGLQLNLTIKRNVDAALPASHIIELFFTVPPGFSGGNIDQVSRFVMKSTEQARGESLVGVPARIDAGFFLIALNNLEQAQQTNLGLLETANWIDVPITYLTGRRGLVTLEKGATGKKIFSEALADWRNR